MENVSLHRALRLIVREIEIEIERHYFFFSALWWTRMAAPKAPRPICSMISY